MTKESSFLEWDKYIINIKSIGKGSYSKVYQGYHKENKTEIAMKKILFNKLQSTIKDKKTKGILSKSIESMYNFLSKSFSK